MDTELNTLHGNAKKTGKSDSTYKAKSDEELLKKGDNEQILEIIPIEETPFSAVRMKKDWFLTMGKYRLTEKLESLEACKEQSKDASWFRIMQIINILINEHEQGKKQAEPKIANQLTIN